MGADASLQGLQESCPDFVLRLQKFSKPPRIEHGIDYQGQPKKHKVT